MEGNGLFIALEGSDGSGKTTQFNLLAERLRAAGHEVDIYGFPRYEEPSSYFVKRYLNGEYGPASEVSPYTASLFYALDRFEAAPLIRQSLADGKIVLTDRYTGSNMAHQGAKFTKSGEQRGFFVWAESLEFQLLGIPRPTVNIFLRVPAEASQKLIEKRNEGQHEHEDDIEHLRSAVSAFDTLCQLFTKDFKSINCSKAGKLLSIAEVNNRIWDVLKPMLPQPRHAGHSTVVSLSRKPQLADEQSGGLTVERLSDSFAKSREIKDISLLAVSNLLARGLPIDYELKWPPAGSKPRLEYFIPVGLPPKLASKYKSTMDKLIANGRRLSEVLPRAAKDYANHIVPLAALVDARIDGDSEAGELVLESSSPALAELRQIAKKTRTELKEPQALKQIIKQIAETGLDANSGELDEHVRLIIATPRNELDLLADCLYQYSNVTRDEITAQVETWSYEQKATALKALCSSDARTIFNKINYRFDVLDGVINLERLVRDLRPTEVQTQAPTPRYGYDVPAAIEEAALDELFIECFDLSLELYSDIQAAGLVELAGYAVLTGHRQRWQFSSGGESIFKPGADSATVKHLKEQIAEVHPLISASVRQNTSQNLQKNKRTGHSARKSAADSSKKKPSGKRRGTKSKK